MAEMLPFFCVVGSLALASCASDNARALSLAAKQFALQSQAAINSIDTMRQQETAPPNNGTKSREFANNVLVFRGPIAADTVEFLVNPDVVTTTPETERRWAGFLLKVREQYATFARIFDDLERASLLGRSVVREAAPHLEKLTAQMASFATAIEEHPPQMLARRGELIAQLELIRQADAIPEVKRRQLELWHSTWLELTAAEMEMYRKTAEECLKAALIGYEMRRQMEVFDQVSFANLADGLERGFELAAAVTGRDLSALQGQSAQLIAAIQNDPIWSSVAKPALAEINAPLRSPALARNSLGVRDGY